MRSARIDSSADPARLGGTVGPRTRVGARRREQRQCRAGPAPGRARGRAGPAAASCCDPTARPARAWSSSATPGWARAGCWTARSSRPARPVGRCCSRAADAARPSSPSPGCTSSCTASSTAATSSPRLSARRCTPRSGWSRTTTSPRPCASASPCSRCCPRWRRTRRCCSSSTTPSGSTPPRWTRWPSSYGGRPRSRSCCWPAPAARSLRGRWRRCPGSRSSRSGPGAASASWTASRRRCAAPTARRCCRRRTGTPWPSSSWPAPCPRSPAPHCGGRSRRCP